MMSPQHKYCVYCGRVVHRCQCARSDSSLRQFLSRRPVDFVVQLRPDCYQRGVPPQIKRRERATLRRQYKVWLAMLIERYGERCLNCGSSGETIQLVIDHVLPIAKGGLSEYENLQLLCAECNRLKGKLVIDCRSHA